VSPDYQPAAKTQDYYRAAQHHLAERAQRLLISRGGSGAQNAA